MTIGRWLIAACWLVFVGYWLVSAARAKKTVRGTTRSLGWRVLLALALVLIFPKEIADWLGSHPAPASLQPVGDAIGALLCAAGIAFAIWARRQLGSNWGMPMAIKDGPELVTSGPYAYVRHPIYLGILLAMLGSALVGGRGWLILAIAAAAYFVYSANAEEKIMMSRFPMPYSVYRRKTKMLVPWLF